MPPPAAPPIACAAARCTVSRPCRRPLHRTPSVPPPHRPPSIVHRPAACRAAAVVRCSVEPWDPTACALTQLGRSAQGALADKGLGEEMIRTLRSGTKNTSEAVAKDRRHSTKAMVIDSEGVVHMRDDGLQGGAVICQGDLEVPLQYKQPVIDRF